MLVPDVHVHELRGEVEVAVAVVVPEVPSFGARDRDRVDRVLHRPRVEDVLLGIRGDLRPEGGFVSIVVMFASWSVPPAIVARDALDQLLAEPRPLDELPEPRLDLQLAPVDDDVPRMRTVSMSPVTSVPS